MRTSFALLRRELGVYFVSPMAYLILTALLFLTSLGFNDAMARAATNLLPADYVQTLMFILWVIVIASPLITMRLVAEEKNRGTIETLMTSPVSEFQVVGAKFGAALVFLAYLLSLTLFYPIIMSMYGEIDLGAVLCGYVGIMMVGALMFSIGIFISALCENQITAGIIAMMVSLIMVFATLAGSLFDHPVWHQVLDAFNLTSNMVDFLRGVVDLTRVTFILSTVIFFLFLTVRVVQSRRWR